MSKYFYKVGEDGKRHRVYYEVTESELKVENESEENKEIEEDNTEIEEDNLSDLKCVECRPYKPPFKDKAKYILKELGRFALKVAITTLAVFGAFVIIYLILKKYL